MMRFHDAATVTHQPAGGGEGAGLTNTGHRMPRRERAKLLAAIGKERLVGDHQPSHMKLRHRFERRLEILLLARIQYVEVQLQRDRGRVQISECGLGIHRIGRIDEQRKVGSRGQELVQQLETLGPDFGIQGGNAGQVAAGPHPGALQKAPAIHCPDNRRRVSPLPVPQPATTSHCPRHPEMIAFSFPAPARPPDQASAS